MERVIVNHHECKQIRPK